MKKITVIFLAIACIATIAAINIDENPPEPLHEPGFYVWLANSEWRTYPNELPYVTWETPLGKIGDTVMDWSIGTNRACVNQFNWDFLESKWTIEGYPYPICTWQIQCHYWAFELLPDAHVDETDNNPYMECIQLDVTRFILEVISSTKWRVPDPWSSIYIPFNLGNGVWFGVR